MDSDHPEPGLELSITSAEHRGNCALALCLACMSFKGDKFDMGQLMGLADEYLAYIEGDEHAPIPRPDKGGSRDITVGPLRK